MALQLRPNETSYLPPEVLEIIIGSILDSQHLPCVWFNFRRVSRGFKEITERVFAQQHLQHSRITNVRQDFFVFTTRESLARVEGERLDLDFDRLTDGGNRVVYTEKFFSDDPEKIVTFGRRRRLVKASDLLDGFRGGWKASHKRAQEPDWDPCAPCRQLTEKAPLPHVFSLRGIANDTELPGAEYDFESLTVSFLWKPALSKLFGEEEHIKWLQEHKSQQTPDNDLPEAGNDRMMGRVPGCSKKAVGAAMRHPLEYKSIVQRARRARTIIRCRGEGKSVTKEDEVFGGRNYLAKESEVLAIRSGFSATSIPERILAAEEQGGEDFHRGVGNTIPTNSGLTVEGDETMAVTATARPRLDLPHAIIIDQRHFVFNLNSTPEI